MTIEYNDSIVSKEDTYTWRDANYIRQALHKILFLDNNDTCKVRLDKYDHYGFTFTVRLIDDGKYYPYHIFGIKDPIYALKYQLEEKLTEKIWQHTWDSEYEKDNPHYCKILKEIMLITNQYTVSEKLYVPQFRVNYPNRDSSKLDLVLSILKLYITQV